MSSADMQKLALGVATAAVLAAGSAGLLLWKESVPRSDLAALAEKVQALKEEQIRVGGIVTMGLQNIQVQLDDLKRNSRPPVGGGAP